MAIIIILIINLIMKDNPCAISFSFQYHIDLGNGKISHILITE